MSIQMTKQSSIQLIITSVKDFKRTGQKITELIRQNHNQQALTLLQKQQKNAMNIELTLKQCEEGYLNPEVAKKLMIIRNQFKEQRSKLAKLFHTVRIQSEQNNEEDASKQQEDGFDGFDYEIESRLLKQKQESLTQVHKKINNINTIMLQTNQMAHKQGQTLDLVSDHLQKTKQNAVQSNKHLQQANKLSSSSNKRCIWIIIVTMTIICVILLLVLLSCLFMDHKTTSTLIIQVYFSIFKFRFSLKKLIVINLLVKIIMGINFTCKSLKYAHANKNFQDSINMHQKGCKCFCWLYDIYFGQDQQIYQLFVSSLIVATKCQRQMKFLEMNLLIECGYSDLKQV